MIIGSEPQVNHPAATLLHLSACHGEAEVPLPCPVGMSGLRPVSLSAFCPPTEFPESTDGPAVGAKRLSFTGRWHDFPSTTTALSWEVPLALC